MSRTSRILVAAAWLLLVSCAASASRPKDEKGPNPSATSFWNQGKEVIFGADLRAARITGPDAFLPVQVVLVNRTQRTLAVDPESFTLLRPDGTSLPVASPEEFWRDYRRAKADLRMGVPFLENVFGRYPAPPFHWSALELFPEKFSGGVPRQGIALRFGEGTYGYLYFRQPGEEGAGGGGLYKLLLRPRGSDETYVLDFYPYKRDKKAGAEPR